MVEATKACRNLDLTLRALLVEDQIMIRLDLAETLRKAGWDVVEAGSAEHAISVLKRDPDFHILLTDVHMTGSLTGLDLARFSKSKCPNIKVAVMSGLHRPNSEDEAIFDLFIPKPILNLLEELLPLHHDPDD